MVSEISKQSNNFLRSQGAIASEKYRHLRENRYIIHPFSDARYYYRSIELCYINFIFAVILIFRKWWEFFVSWVFLLQFFLIPLDLAYFRIPNTVFFRYKLWKWTRMILDCLCLIDVCINFATGYYSHQKKQAVLTPHIIAGYVNSYINFFISKVGTTLNRVANAGNSEIVQKIFLVLKMSVFWLPFEKKRNKSIIFLKVVRNVSSQLNKLV